MSAFVHPTAILEEGVTLGEGTAVWDNVHIRRGTRIGRRSIIGEKTHIAYDVRVGSLVKINAFVYICTGVTIEDAVMISAGTVFTNDRFPRAADPECREPLSSAPDEHTLPTLVRIGATIGAGCVIGNDLAIGRFAMVGMGSVVTRTVHDFHLVFGNPARTAGYVCRCGRPLARFAPGALLHGEFTCSACGRRYLVDAQSAVSELFVAELFGSELFKGTSLA